MAVRTRVEPLEQDIALVYKQDLSPEAQSATLAQFAYEQIEEAKQTNRRALGVVPAYTTWVDGREDAPLKSVKPDGEVFTEFELLQEALAWIDQQLTMHSPVLKGHYQRSHEFFADNAEADPDRPPAAQEYVFVNSVPYARKIEGLRSRGETTRPPQSRQAPHGVYQVVAELAQRKFGNIARITYSFRTIQGGERNPAIIVKMRG